MGMTPSLCSGGSQLTAMRQCGSMNRLFGGTDSCATPSMGCRRGSGDALVELGVAAHRSKCCMVSESRNGSQSGVSLMGLMRPQVFSCRLFLLNKIRGFWIGKKAQAG